MKLSNKEKKCKQKSLLLFMDVHQRKSHTSLSKIYFWTATIHKWLPLLENDFNKQIIVDSLKYLSDKELITVYAFVIMPNHIHLIWQQNDLNGKETPKGSLLKHSAHLFLKQLKENRISKYYEVNEANKKHEIWQRDSLGIEIYSKEVAKQKINYIHFNPVSGKWLLAKDDLGYHFSSAKFYETGVDEFGFLKNIFTLFDGD
jgi:putative transposase